MATFGDKSSAKLATAHPVLEQVARAVIVVYDHTIIFGWRGQEDQDEAYRVGNSTKPWSESKHNYIARHSDVEDGHAAREGDPMSLGLDWAPWYYERPHVRWNRLNEFIYLAGLYVMAGDAIAKPAGYAIRWGGNWDMDQILITDQTLADLGHVELVKV